MLITLNYFYVLFTVFCSFNGFVFSKKLPVFMRNLRCPMNKDFDTCFIASGNKAIPLIARGNPEFGIPKMTPLKIPFVSLVSAPTLKVNLTNVEIHGLDKLKIENHITEMDKGKFTVYLRGENITVVGDYSADGSILFVTLRGRGKYSMYLKNGLYISVHVTKIMEKNGEKYLQPLDSSFHAKFEQIVFHLDNLFDGNKQLGDQVNTFLNEHWAELVADFGPSIGKSISRNIDNIFNNFSATVPLSELFL